MADNTTPSTFVVNTASTSGAPLTPANYTPPTIPSTIPTYAQPMGSNYSGLPIPDVASNLPTYTGGSSPNVDFIANSSNPLPQYSPDTNYYWNGMQTNGNPNIDFIAGTQPTSMPINGSPTAGPANYIANNGPTANPTFVGTLGGANPLDVITGSPTAMPVLATTSGGGIVTKAKAGRPGHVNTGVSQGFRHYTILFKNDIENKVYVVNFNVNPEDFSIDTPYRVTPVQTAGGAFVDMWGEGINKIMFRGHTGWRTIQMPEQMHDGFDNLKAIKTVVVDAYHKARDQYATKYTSKELDDKLRVTLVDRLHMKAWRVVPEYFRLMRNRQRPLLHMYDMSFIVVDNDKENYEKYSKNQDAQLAGLFGELADRANALANKAKDAKLGKMQSFLQKMNKGLSKVAKGMQTALNAKNAVMNGIASVANVYNSSVMAVRSGIGMIQSLADLSTISLSAKSMLWDTKSLYTQMGSLLNEVKAGGMYTFTGHVGNTYAPAPFGQGFGFPPLAETTNSFEALKAPSTSKLDSVMNSISTNSQSFVSKVNSFDVKNFLTGN